MRTRNDVRRWTTGLLLAAFAVAAMSPAAHAGNGSRRYKGTYYCPPPVRHVHHAPQRVVYIERQSSAAPLFAGLIGGLVIGSVLAQASAPPHPVYYWDPYCHERFSSLGIYHSHFYHHDHPRVVRVISVDSGDCVNTYRWYDGDWRSAHGDWGN